MKNTKHNGSTKRKRSLSHSILTNGSFSSGTVLHKMGQSSCSPEPPLPSSSFFSPLSLLDTLTTPSLRHLTQVEDHHTYDTKRNKETVRPHANPGCSPLRCRKKVEESQEEEKLVDVHPPHIEEDPLPSLLLSTSSFRDTHTSHLLSTLHPPDVQETRWDAVSPLKTALHHAKKSHDRVSSVSPPLERSWFFSSSSSRAFSPRKEKDPNAGFMAMEKMRTPSRRRTPSRSPSQAGWRTGGGKRQKQTSELLSSWLSPTSTSSGMSGWLPTTVFSSPRRSPSPVPFLPCSPLPMATASTVVLPPHARSPSPFMSCPPVSALPERRPSLCIASPYPTPSYALLREDEDVGGGKRMERPCPDGGEKRPQPARAREEVASTWTAVDVTPLGEAKHTRVPVEGTLCEGLSPGTASRARPPYSPTAGTSTSSLESQYRVVYEWCRQPTWERCPSSGASHASTSGVVAVLPPLLVPALRALAPASPFLFRQGACELAKLVVHGIHQAVEASFSSLSLVGDSDGISPRATPTTTTFAVTGTINRESSPRIEPTRGNEKLHPYHDPRLARRILWRLLALQPLITTVLQVLLPYGWMRRETLPPLETREPSSFSLPATTHIMSSASSCVPAPLSPFMRSFCALLQQLVTRMEQCIEAILYGRLSVMRTQEEGEEEATSFSRPQDLDASSAALKALFFPVGETFLQLLRLVSSPSSSDDAAPCAGGVWESSVSNPCPPCPPPPVRHTARETHVKEAMQVLLWSIWRSWWCCWRPDLLSLFPSLQEVKGNRVGCSSSGYPTDKEKISLFISSSSLPFMPTVDYSREVMTYVYTSVWYTVSMAVTHTVRVFCEEKEEGRAAGGVQEEGNDCTPPPPPHRHEKKGLEETEREVGTDMDPISCASTGDASSVPSSLRAPQEMVVMAWLRCLTPLCPRAALISMRAALTSPLVSRVANEREKEVGDGFTSSSSDKGSWMLFHFSSLLQVCCRCLTPSSCCWSFSRVKRATPTAACRWWWVKCLSTCSSFSSFAVPPLSGGDFLPWYQQHWCRGIRSVLLHVLYQGMCTSLAQFQQAVGIVFLSTSSHFAVPHASFSPSRGTAENEEQVVPCTTSSSLSSRDTSLSPASPLRWNTQDTPVQRSQHESSFTSITMKDMKDDDQPSPHEASVPEHQIFQKEEEWQGWRMLQHLSHCLTGVNPCQHASSRSPTSPVPQECVSPTHSSSTSFGASPFPVSSAFIHPGREESEGTKRTSTEWCGAEGRRILSHWWTLAMEVGAIDEVFADLVMRRTQNDTEETQDIGSTMPSSPWCASPGAKSIEEAQEEEDGERTRTKRRTKDQLNYFFTQEEREKVLPTLFSLALEFLWDIHTPLTGEACEDEEEEENHGPPHSSLYTATLDGKEEEEEMRNGDLLHPRRVRNTSTSFSHSCGRRVSSPPNGTIFHSPILLQLLAWLANQRLSERPNKKEKKAQEEEEGKEEEEGESSTILSRTTFLLHRWQRWRSQLQSPSFSPSLFCFLSSFSTNHTKEERGAAVLHYDDLRPLLLQPLTSCISAVWGEVEEEEKNNRATDTDHVAITEARHAEVIPRTSMEDGETNISDTVLEQKKINVFAQSVKEMVLEYLWTCLVHVSTTTTMRLVGRAGNPNEAVDSHVLYGNRRKRSSPPHSWDPLLPFTTSSSPSSSTSLSLLHLRAIVDELFQLSFSSSSLSTRAEEGRHGVPPLPSTSSGVSRASWLALCVQRTTKRGDVWTACRTALFQDRLVVQLLYVGIALLSHTLLCSYHQFSTSWKYVNQLTHCMQRPFLCSPSGKGISSSLLGETEKTIGGREESASSTSPIQKDGLQGGFTTLPVSSPPLPSSIALSRLLCRLWVHALFDYSCVMMRVPRWEYSISSSPLMEDHTGRLGASLSSRKRIEKEREAAAETWYTRKVWRAIHASLLPMCTTSLWSLVPFRSSLLLATGSTSQSCQFSSSSCFDGRYQLFMEIQCHLGPLLGTTTDAASGACLPLHAWREEPHPTTVASSSAMERIERERQGKGEETVEEEESETSRPFFSCSLAHRLHPSSSSPTRWLSVGIETSSFDPLSRIRRMDAEDHVRFTVRLGRALASWLSFSSLFLSSYTMVELTLRPCHQYVSITRHLFYFSSSSSLKVTPTTPPPTAFISLSFPFLPIGADVLSQCRTLTHIMHENKRQLFQGTSGDGTPSSSMDDATLIKLEWWAARVALEEELQRTVEHMEALFYTTIPMGHAIEMEQPEEETASHTPGVDKKEGGGRARSSEETKRKKVKSATTSSFFLGQVSPRLYTQLHEESGKLTQEWVEALWYLEKAKAKPKRDEAEKQEEEAEEVRAVTKWTEPEMMELVSVVHSSLLLLLQGLPYLSLPDEALSEKVLQEDVITGDVPHPAEHTRGEVGYGLREAEDDPTTEGERIKWVKGYHAPPPVATTRKRKRTAAPFSAAASGSSVAWASGLATRIAQQTASLQQHFSLSSLRWRRDAASMEDCCPVSATAPPSKTSSYSEGESTDGCIADHATFEARHETHTSREDVAMLYSLTTFFLASWKDAVLHLSIATSSSTWAAGGVPIADGIHTEDGQPKQHRVSFAALIDEVYTLFVSSTPPPAVVPSSLETSPAHRHIGWCSSPPAPCLPPLREQEFSSPHSHVRWPHLLHHLLHTIRRTLFAMADEAPSILPPPSVSAPPSDLTTTTHKTPSPSSSSWTDPRASHDVLHKSSDSGGAAATSVVFPSCVLSPHAHPPHTNSLSTTPLGTPPLSSRFHVLPALRSPTSVRSMEQHVTRPEGGQEDPAAVRARGSPPPLPLPPGNAYADIRRLPRSHVFLSIQSSSSSFLSFYGVPWEVFHVCRVHSISRVPSTAYVVRTLWEKEREEREVQEALPHRPWPPCAALSTTLPPPRKQAQGFMQAKEEEDDAEVSRTAVQEAEDDKSDGETTFPVSKEPHSSSSPLFLLQRPFVVVERTSTQMLPAWQALGAGQARRRTREKEATTTRLPSLEVEEDDVEGNDRRRSPCASSTVKEEEVQWAPTQSGGVLQFTDTIQAFLLQHMRACSYCRKSLESSTRWSFSSSSVAALLWPFLHQGWPCVSTSSSFFTMYLYVGHKGGEQVMDCGYLLDGVPFSLPVLQKEENDHGEEARGHRSKRRNTAETRREHLQHLPFQPPSSSSQEEKEETKVRNREDVSAHGSYSLPSSSSSFPVVFLMGCSSAVRVQPLEKKRRTHPRKARHQLEEEVHEAKNRKEKVEKEKDNDDDEEERAEENQRNKMKTKQVDREDGIPSSLLLLPQLPPPLATWPLPLEGGLPYAYLHARSPSVVACLWDVTDMDVDGLLLDILGQPHGNESRRRHREKRPRTSFSSSFPSRPLLSLLSSDDHSSLTSLGEALARSRVFCKLPMLTGGATVLFGMNYSFVEDMYPETPPDPLQY